MNSTHRGLIVIHALSTTLCLIVTTKCVLLDNFKKINFLKKIYFVSLEGVEGTPCTIEDKLHQCGA